MTKLELETNSTPEMHPARSDSEPSNNLTTLKQTIPPVTFVRKVPFKTVMHAETVHLFHNIRWKPINGNLYFQKQNGMEKLRNRSGKRRKTCDLPPWIIH